MKALTVICLLIISGCCDGRMEEVEGFNIHGPARYEPWYFTQSYKEDGPCVSFDGIKLCGTYTIAKETHFQCVKGN